MQSLIVVDVFIPLSARDLSLQRTKEKGILAGAKRLVRGTVVVSFSEEDSI